MWKKVKRDGCAENTQVAPGISYFERTIVILLKMKFVLIIQTMHS